MESTLWALTNCAIQHPRERGGDERETERDVFSSHRDWGRAGTRCEQPQGRVSSPRAEIRTQLSFFSNVHKCLSLMATAGSIFLCPGTGYLIFWTVKFPQLFIADNNSTCCNKVAVWVQWDPVCTWSGPYKVLNDLWLCYQLAEYTHITYLYSPLHLLVLFCCSLPLSLAFSLGLLLWA